MRTACYVEPERPEKSLRFMRSFARGCPDAALIQNGSFHTYAKLHVFWGHRWTAEELVPRVKQCLRHHVIIDNGWWDGSNGRPGIGNYRTIVDGPVYKLPKNDKPGDRLEKFGVKVQEQRVQGDVILLCMPGPHFGLPWSIDVHEWESTIVDRINEHTDYPVLIRRKGEMRPIQQDFDRARALVTHSSSVAVHAAIRGIPVFCEPSCPAFSVSNSMYLDQLDDPVLMEESVIKRWAAKLSYQQWDITEYGRGLAWPHIMECF